MSMPLDEVEKWMSWTKKIVKQYNCIFSISHMCVRQVGWKQHRQKFSQKKPTLVSGSQFPVCWVSIALQRDKNNEDEIVRNTTSVRYSVKSRANRLDRKWQDLYYDSDTHTLWDKNGYFSK